MSNYYKIYYENNKDKMKESSQLYYQKNRERISKQNQDNKDKMKEASQLYYQKNKERILCRAKLYYQENKDKIQSYNRQYWAEHGYKYMEERKLNTHMLNIDKKLKSYIDPSKLSMTLYFN